MMTSINTTNIIPYTPNDEDQTTNTWVYLRRNNFDTPARRIYTIRGYDDIQKHSIGHFHSDNVVDRDGDVSQVNKTLLTFIEERVHQSQPNQQMHPYTIIP